MKKIMLTILLATVPTTLHAKLTVITTTTNLASLVGEIGGDKVSVESLCKGTQDPHFLEAKPSYIFKLSKADLLVDVGGGLEEGWLPLVVRGARNPDLIIGGKGRLTGAESIKLIEQLKKKVTRSDGDVHPEGNPHFMLGPSVALEFSAEILKRLIMLDKKNTEYYQANHKKFSSALTKQLTVWKKQFKPGAKVVSYHKTLSYFYKEFGVRNEMVLEPKPGIPPTASHIISVMSHLKKEKINKIIVENYFDPAVAMRIQKDQKDVNVLVVPVAVNGSAEVGSLLALYGHLVKNIGM